MSTERAWSSSSGVVIVIHVKSFMLPKPVPATPTK